MRSRCRSFFLSLLFISGFAALQTGAAPGVSEFLSQAAMAKGADAAPAAESDAGDSGSACSASRAPGGVRRRFGGFAGEGMSALRLDFSMLDLTEEQKNKIKTIRGRNAARGKELRQSLMTKGNEMRELLFSDTATNDQILAKRDEIKPIKEELDNLRLNDFLAIRSVFTSEQRKKWAEAKPPDMRPHGRGGADAECEKSDKPAAKSK